MCFGEIVHCCNHPNCPTQTWALHSTCADYDGTAICNLQFVTGIIYSDRWLCKNCIVAVKKACAEKFINENKKGFGLTPGEAMYALRFEEIREAVMGQLAEVPLQMVRVRLNELARRLMAEGEKKRTDEEKKEKKVEYEETGKVLES